MKKIQSPYTKAHINRTKEILTTCPPDCFHGPHGICILKNQTLGFGYVKHGDIISGKFVIYPLAPEGHERPALTYQSAEDMIAAFWVVD